ncbi:hypothetical protein [Crateriforma conspicua]|uniref:Uncharacterized protein n=1 Tax=Crateriforma conspicua TaxID=2527996 RepID=A0A5C5Y6R6_9PLAN|nr:hypothetical protein [Crateriforma conspicua]TWT70960.1 hypothetical protein Pan14r_32690 [Crateriforma conspicua]
MPKLSPEELVEQFNRDADGVLRLFERLPAVSASFVVNQRAMFSRFAIRRECPHRRRTPEQELCATLQFSPMELHPRRIGETERENANCASIFYDRNGNPVVNVNGDALITSAGWTQQATLYIQSEGGAIDAVDHAIECASRFAKRYGELWYRVLYQGERITIPDKVWPYLVYRIAEVAKSVTLLPLRYFVQVSETLRVDVQSWKQFSEDTVLGIPEKIRDAIGPEPEEIWAMSNSPIQDSIEALLIFKDLCGRELSEGRAAAETDSQGTGFEWQWTTELRDQFDEALRQHRSKRDWKEESDGAKQRQARQKASKARKDGTVLDCKTDFERGFFHSSHQTFVFKKTQKPQRISILRASHKTKMRKFFETVESIKRDAKRRLTETD